MAQVKRSCKILGSKAEIMEYIGGVSEHKFRRYIDAGMPARLEEGRWCAHADNIDEWFRRYTKVVMRGVPVEKEGDE